MGAIAKHYDIKSVIHQTLDADIDIILICHKGPNIQSAYETILKMFEESPEFEARGIESVERIMKAKKKYLGI
jgi:beta-N-acetylhexosaminidase